MPRNQTLKKVGIASVIMMASVFLSRIMGVFREMAIAGMGGIDPAVDAYQVAFIIPEILNHVAATGFLSITFIPIFTGYLTRGEEEEGFRVFSIILNTAGAGLVVLIIAGMILAPQLVALFSPGLQGTPAFDLAVKMTRIVIPAQFFFFAGGLWMAVLFARENFFIPALAPLIYNLSIIGFGLALGPVLGM